MFAIWISESKNGFMSGIQFVVDKEGKKTAVVIDLKRHGKLWEDIYDDLIADSRAKEPRVPWRTVKAKPRRAGKLNGEV